MKTIFADYNAMTESGHISLTSLGSEEDIRDAQLQVGDWAWLSDGEIVVGARLEMDSYYGLVGVPDWETMVHLDDENDQDPNKLAAEFQQLSQKQDRSSEEEARIFQILTLLETFTPPVGGEPVQPGLLALRRAFALQRMGKSELASVEFTEASRQAEAEAEKPGASAAGLADSIGIEAIIASVYASDEDFRDLAPRILEWSDRFVRIQTEQAVPASVSALVHFNRGMILLRLGRIDDARRSFEFAHQIDPSEQVFGEATRLVSYDEHARELASRVHAAVPIAA